MSKQYGFHVNTSRCTGCKTCEMACRDAYQLGETPSFRRVCEASGGTWVPEGDAWHHQVFAYYVSVACNHCDDPVCQQVCPSGAMRKQDDGFVVLDSNRCIGCGSRVAAGREPVCVEACPMRALEFGEIGDLRARYGDACDVAPLPAGGFTRPNLVITPHRHARSSEARECALSNEKEI